MPVSGEEPEASAEALSLEVLRIVHAGGDLEQVVRAALAAAGPGSAAIPQAALERCRARAVHAQEWERAATMLELALQTGLFSSPRPGGGPAPE